MKQLLSAVAMMTVVLAGSIPQQASGQNVPGDAGAAAANVTAAASQQKAQTVIREAIAALGGDTWLHRRDGEFTGRRSHFFQGKPTGEIVSYWEFRQYPDKVRYEFTNKRDIAQLYLGDKGWEITYKGKEELPVKQMDDRNRDRAHSLETLLTQWASDPKTILIYEGQGLVERHLADKISLIDSRNDSATLEFDARSHLPIRRTYVWRDPLYRDKNEDAEEYDDYHTFDGIATPFALTRYHNGDMTGQTFLFTAQYNRGVAPELFDLEATTRRLKH